MKPDPLSPSPCPNSATSIRSNSSPVPFDRYPKGPASRPDRQIPTAARCGLTRSPTPRRAPPVAPTPGREVSVQPVIGLVPLRHPRIRAHPITRSPAQTTEEHPQVLPQQHRIVIPATPIGEGPQPVQPVRRAVPAQLTPGTTSRLHRRPLRINLSNRRQPATSSTTNPSASLTGTAVDLQRPATKRLA